MPVLKSALPRFELRPYVRAYAQRNLYCGEPTVVEPVPAQLEQVLNFELGALPGICHRQYKCRSTVWIGGAQISFPGYMRLFAGVESFAVFFHPLGWSRLFGIPAAQITNRIHDANLVMGPPVGQLWHRLIETTSFERRVETIEQFLLARVPDALGENAVASAVALLFRRRGDLRINEIFDQHLRSLRQFERLFRAQVGASPKAFARVARFQAALDTKLASPGRTWIDIAHSLGYYDQMHMIHDFKSLGQNSPTQLVLEIGDIRPPALVCGEM
jgi:AraC-like DNA-binding protein